MMSHFTNDVRAIVLYSYKDECGGSEEKEQDYALFIEGEGYSAWYEEWQLTLISSQQMGLLTSWKEEKKRIGCGKRTSGGHACGTTIICGDCMVELEEDEDEET